MTASIPSTRSFLRACVYEGAEGFGFVHGAAVFYWWFISLSVLAGVTLLLLQLLYYALIVSYLYSPICSVECRSLYWMQVRVWCRFYILMSVAIFSKDSRKIRSFWYREFICLLSSVFPRKGEQKMYSEVEEAK